MSKRFSITAGTMLVVASQALAGVYYTAVTTSDGGQSHSGARGDNSTIKAWVDQGNGRVEFVENANPMMGPGSYLLTKDGGKTMYLVNTKDQTYMKWDMERMMQFAGGMMKMMSPTISDPKVEKLLDEADGEILGYPTRHYRFQTSYTMEMNMMGMKNTSSTLQEQDIWATIKFSDAAMGLWLKRAPMKTGNTQLDALIKAQMEKMEGFPLKSVTTSTVKDGRGNTRVTTTTTEVKDLKQTAIPSATFDLPAAYKEISMMPSDADMQKAQQSAAEANQKADEAVQQANDAVQQATQPTPAPTPPPPSPKDTLLNLFHKLP